MYISGRPLVVDGVSSNTTLKSVATQKIKKSETDIAYDEGAKNGLNKIRFFFETSVPS